MTTSKMIVGSAVLSACLIATPAFAHKLRSAGERVAVADSPMEVVPNRDWNRLDVEVGKLTETWTLDGEQLNDLTFYGGISPGKPLIRERNKKRDPLPKFTSNTLLPEIPELLEGTYRTAKGLAAFEVQSTEPAKFLDAPGVRFTYEYTDSDNLTRKGEAFATIVKGKLYMMTFDAPRLHYFGQAIESFHQISAAATLKH